MAQKIFYGDLRIEVLYTPVGGGMDSRMHLYDGGGMTPQFVIPNLLAAIYLKDALCEAIAEAEQVTKQK